MQTLRGMKYLSTFDCMAVCMYIFTFADIVQQQAFVRFTFRTRRGCDGVRPHYPGWRTWHHHNSADGRRTRSSAGLRRALSWNAPVDAPERLLRTRLRCCNQRAAGLLTNAVAFYQICCGY
jgi:hypothetical protein